MFIETHVDNLYAEQLALTFIKSLNVQAFPCGRRRSAFIDQNNNGKIDASETTRIPFDPEARLNTEANNRKHSGLNGYTQTYLNKWDVDNNMLSISLAGYLFNITLEADCVSDAEFGYKVFETIRDKLVNMAANVEGFSFDNESFNENSRIYANILIEDTQLFSGFHDYYTGVLRNQSADDFTPAVLDILCSNINAYEENDPTYHYYVDDPGSYYFSGLSFSVQPLTGSTDTTSERYIKESRQTIVSLCLLEKVDGKWKIYEPAYLPKITHGPTADSIAIGDLYTTGLNTTSANITDKFTVQASGDIELRADTGVGHSGSITAEIVSAKKLIQNGMSVPVIKLAQSTDDKGEECWQLQINLGSKE